MVSGTLKGKSDVLIAYQPAPSMAGIALENNCHLLLGRSQGTTNKENRTQRNQIR
jgi:hypothetical protein